MWPGDLTAVPKGLEWEMLTGKKLRIGVPVKQGFREFVNREWNPLTNRNGSGFCIEVFGTVMASLPYNVPYEYIPFEDVNGKMKGSYNDLVFQVYLQVSSQSSSLQFFSTNFNMTSTMILVCSTTDFSLIG